MFTFIDVSRSQIGIDFAATGLDGCAIKASGANDGFYIAGGYAGHLAKARPVWDNVLHYFFNGPEGTPSQAADYFLNNLDWRPGDGVALDVEDETNAQGVKVTDAYTPDEAYEFCKRVKERNGLAPVIYASASLLRRLDWSKCIGLGCLPWPAAWGANDGKPASSWPDLGPQWGGANLWQYTSQGTVPGWSGRVDLNLSRTRIEGVHGMTTGYANVNNFIVILADNRDPEVSWANHIARGSLGGVDCVAPIGTPIYAPADCYLANTPNNGTGGNTITMSFNDGWRDQMMHLSQFVAPGSKRRGEVVGYSGDSAAPGQPHVHWHRIDPSGTRRNPWHYFTTSGTAGGGTTPIEEDDMNADQEAKLNFIFDAIKNGGTDMKDENRSISESLAMINGDIIRNGNEPADDAANRTGQYSKDQELADQGTILRALYKRGAAAIDIDALAAKIAALIEIPAGSGVTGAEFEAIIRRVFLDAGTA